MAKKNFKVRLNHNDWGMACLVSCPLTGSFAKPLYKNYLEIFQKKMTVWKILYNKISG